MRMKMKMKGTMWCVLLVLLCCGGARGIFCEICQGVLNTAFDLLSSSTSTTADNSQWCHPCGDPGIGCAKIG